MPMTLIEWIEYQMILLRKDMKSALIYQKERGRDILVDPGNQEEIAIILQALNTEGTIH